MVLYVKVICCMLGMIWFVKDLPVMVAQHQVGDMTQGAAGESQMTRARGRYRQYHRRAFDKMGSYGYNAQQFIAWFDSGQDG